MAMFSTKNLWNISLLAVFVATFGLASSDSVKWDKDSINVDQGASVSVSCTIKDTDPFGVVRTALVIDGTEFQLSDNRDLKPYFSNTGRYKLDYTEQDSTDVVITITYTGIRGEDSGRLDCYELDQPNVRATLDINVKVPLKSVNLQTKENGIDRDIANGDTYRMIEGQEMGVTCIAMIDGSAVPPTVRISLGAKDITRDFEEVITPVVVDSGDTLAKHSVMVKYKYLTAHPNRMYNQKQLRCSASTEDGTSSQEAYIFLDIYYFPVLSCKTTEYFVQVGKSIGITCDLRSNPGANLTYLFSGQDGELTLEEHLGREQFRIEPKMISGDHTKININIHRVGDTHFGRYFIRANNEYGSGQTEFLLRKGATEVDIKLEPSGVVTKDSSSSKSNPATKLPTTIKQSREQKDNNVPRELASTNAAGLPDRSNLCLLSVIALGHILTILLNRFTSS